MVEHLFRKITETCIKHKYKNTPKDIKNICRMYMQENNDYDEEKIIGYIEKYGLKKNIQLNPGLENTSNWRAQRRNSVISDVADIFQSEEEEYQDNKDPDVYILIESSLRRSIFFDILNTRQKRRLINCTYIQNYKKDDIIIKEGDIGDRMYIVNSGVFEVFSDDFPPKLLEIGDFFGEISVIHNVPRTATVKCVEDGGLWVIEQHDFYNIKSNDRNRTKRIIYEGLETKNIYKDADDFEMTDYVATLKFLYNPPQSKVKVGENEFFMFTRDGAIYVNDKERQVVKHDIIMESFVCKTVIEGSILEKKIKEYPGLLFNESINQ